MQIVNQPAYPTLFGTRLDPLFGLGSPFGVVVVEFDEGGVMLQLTVN